MSMTLGQQMTTLRKKKGLAQSEMSKAIGTSGDIIGRYERDEVKPSVEVAAKIAQALGVSLDFLVGNTDMLLEADVIKRIQDIQNLPAKDRDHLYYVVDNILQNVKAKKAFPS